MRFNDFMFLGIWAWDQEFNFSLMSAGLNPSFGGGGECILSQTSVTKASKSRIKEKGWFVGVMKEKFCLPDI